MGGGGPNISVGNKFFILFLKNKFRGVHIYRKIGSGGTNFGGNKFVMTRPYSNRAGLHNSVCYSASPVEHLGAIN